MPPKLTKRQKFRLADDIDSKAFKLYHAGLISLNDVDKIGKIADRVRNKVKQGR